LLDRRRICSGTYSAYHRDFLISPQLRIGPFTGILNFRIKHTQSVPN